MSIYTNTRTSSSCRPEAVTPGAFRRGLGHLALVTLATALVAGHASASVLEALTLEDLAARAEQVIRGRVVARHSAWSNDLIVTDVTVTVDVCLAGDCGVETVNVRIVGGQVDDLVMVVEGMARFEIDEEVILFLESAPAVREARVSTRVLRSVGMAQGKFTVVRQGELEWAVRQEHMHRVGRAAASADALDAVPLVLLTDTVRHVLRHSLPIGVWTGANQSPAPAQVPASPRR